MLPVSLKPGYENAPYEKTKETLVLDALSGIEEIELKKFDLEHLPVKNTADFVI